MTEISEEQIEKKLDPEVIRQLLTKRKTANEKAHEVAQPFYDEATACSRELDKIAKIVQECFGTELRQLATYGRTSRYGVQVSQILENAYADNELVVSYRIGHNYNSCKLSALIDKGEFESLAKKREAEKIVAARREAENAAAAASRAQKKLAELKAKASD